MKDLEQTNSSAFILVSGEQHIKAGREVIWDNLIHYSRWQKFQRIEHLTGQAGELGQVVRLTKIADGIELPTYLGRTIYVTPQERIVWNHRSEPGMNWFSGYADFKVKDVAVGYMLEYTLVYEFQVPAGVNALKFQSQQVIRYESLMANVMPELCMLCEVSGAFIDPPGEHL